MSVCPQKPGTGPLLLATMIDTVVGGLGHQISTAGVRRLRVTFPLVPHVLHSRLRDRRGKSEYVRGDKERTASDVCSQTGDMRVGADSVVTMALFGKKTGMSLFFNRF